MSHGVRVLRQQSVCSREDESGGGDQNLQRCLCRSSQPIPRIAGRSPVFYWSGLKTVLYVLVTIKSLCVLAVGPAKQARARVTRVEEMFIRREVRPTEPVRVIIQVRLSLSLNCMLWCWLGFCIFSAKAGLKYRRWTLKRWHQCFEHERNETISANQYQQ